MAAQRIDLIGLNVDTDPEATVAAFLQQTGATYPNYVGGVPVIEKLFASDELTLPLTLLLDEDGVVTELIPGWSAETRRRFAPASPPLEPPGVGSKSQGLLVRP